MLILILLIVGCLLLFAAIFNPPVPRISLLAAGLFCGMLAYTVLYVQSGALH